MDFRYSPAYRQALHMFSIFLFANIHARNNVLDESLTKDECIDIQEDVVLYDKLLYIFEKAEKQS